MLLYFDVFYAFTEYVGELICFLNNIFFKSQTRSDRIMQVQTRIRLFLLKKQLYSFMLYIEEGEQKKYFFVLSPVPQYYSITHYIQSQKILYTLQNRVSVHTRILFYYRRKATTSRPFSCVTFKKYSTPGWLKFKIISYPFFFNFLKAI